MYESFSSITYFGLCRATTQPVSVSLLLLAVIALTPSLGKSGEPPRIEGIVPTPLSSPSPQSPQGRENTPSVIFSWGLTKGADTYVLWYEDGKGRPDVKNFSGAELDCSDVTLVCKTKSAISVSEGMGKWAVRALKGTDSSPWSNTVFFGKAPEGSLYDRCVLKPEESAALTGDLPSSHFWGGEWSVGTAVQAQTIRYDLARNQAGFNTGLGAGVSFRYYRDVKIGGKTVSVSQIKQDCRASTFRLKNESTVAAPLFSLTPTLFVSKLDDTSNLSVQPAIMLGFIEDIVNIGIGFNLTGKPGDVGHVFLLASIGMGFQF
jgi:hypothetical protein